MKIDGKTRLLGILGSGIGHSLSPLLQNYALERLGENLVYLPFEIGAEDLPSMIRLFPGIGGIGLNVTTPHKRAAAEIVPPGDSEAQTTGVINTIVFRDGTPAGFSTDGMGFRSWMREEGIRPGPDGVTILGFGAVARSIAYHLGAEFPVTLVSRSPGEVASTIQAWQARGWRGLPIRVLAWSDPSPGASLLVIGGLPAEAGRSAEVASWLAGCDPSGVVVDLNYGAGRTPLRDQARDRGMITFNGAGLLVHQAALSLSLWLGREVPHQMIAEGMPPGME